MGTLFFLGCLTYLAASVNFSILLFRILGKGDPRDRFSGNAGASNVSRQLGKFWAVVVLLLDVGRAAAVALLGVWLLPASWVPILGLLLVIGNQKPLFHGFRGGKGVAGYLGFTAFLSPITAGLSCLVWVVVYGLFRKPFAGSFFMIGVLGVGIMIRYVWDPVVITATVLTMLIIFWAHKSNVLALQKKGE